MSKVSSNFADNLSKSNCGTSEQNLVCDISFTLASSILLVLLKNVKMYVSIFIEKRIRLLNQENNLTLNFGMKCVILAYLLAAPPSAES